MKNRLSRLLAFLLSGAALFAANACRQAPPPRPPAPVDLAALQPKFEFRGRILFQSDLNGNNDIYLMTRDGLRNLTNDPASDEFPKWSPDGRRIAFSSNRSGRYQIYVMNEDGTDPIQATHSENDAIEQAWFPDGKKIAFTESWKRAFGRSYALFRLDLASGLTEKLLPGFAESNALPENFPPMAGGWDSRGSVYGGVGRLRRRLDDRRRAAH